MSKKGAACAAPLLTRTDYIPDWLTFLHHQFVLHTEGAEELVGSDSGNLFIHRLITEP